jgi:hypothetical protein
MSVFYSQKNKKDVRFLKDPIFLNYRLPTLLSLMYVSIFGTPGDIELSWFPKKKKHRACSACKYTLPSPSCCGSSMCGTHTLPTKKNKEHLCVTMNLIVI